MGAPYLNLLLHTEIRWLSRGNALKRFYELLDVAIEFFSQKAMTDYVKLLTDDKFVATLAYLVDIFEKLNQLNQGLQGVKTNIIVAEDLIRSFQNKLQFWYDAVEYGNFSSFPKFSKHKDIDTPLNGDIKNHLIKLGQKLQHYFPKINSNKNNWVANPFIQGIPGHLNANEKEELIDLSGSRIMKSTYDTNSLETFWIKVNETYKNIGSKAINVLVQFSSTYNCEKAFSVMLGIKTKHRSSLKCLEEELRVNLSNLSPRFEKLVNEKQLHGSH